MDLAVTVFIEHDRTDLAFESDRVVLDREAGRSPRKASKSKASRQKMRKQMAMAMEVGHGAALRCPLDRKLKSYHVTLLAHLL